MEQSLNDYQKKVREVVEKFGLNWSNYVQYIHTMEELAELGEALTVYEGDRSAGSGEGALADHADLKEEIGDVLFSIMEQANKLNINLEDVMEETFRRYERKLEKFKKDTV